MGRSGYNTQWVVTFGGMVADEFGFDQLTLARLAKRMKMRTPSLYAHVEGLDDLRRRIAERGAKELGGRLTAAAFRTVRRGGARRDRHGLSELSHASTRVCTRPSNAPRHSALTRKPLRAPVDAVVSALQGYGLSGDDEIHAVRVVRSALHGFVSLEQSGGFGLKLDLDETFARLVATLHRGLAP